MPHGRKKDLTKIGIYGRMDVQLNMHMSTMLLPSWYVGEGLNCACSVW
jgi:hypothetical protein